LKEPEIAQPGLVPAKRQNSCDKTGQRRDQQPLLKSSSLGGTIASPNNAGSAQ